MAVLITNKYPTCPLPLRSFVGNIRYGDSLAAQNHDDEPICMGVDDECTRRR